MPAAEGPDIPVTSGNCGNPRRRGAGRGAARDKAARAAEAAEAAAAENALVAADRQVPLGSPGLSSPSPSPGDRPGTVLADDTGPEPWQREVLAKLGQGLKSPDEAVRVAVASGHGIGKSALVAWIILWALSTRPDTRGVVTANTEGQLRTKTWPELAKWLALCANRHWFTYTATSLHSANPGRDKTWRVDAITWSENNTEAIAGLHNKGKRAFALFDEASAIPEGVWETVEGALTDGGTELFWAAFGNPTRTTGRFRECFAGGRFAHRWIAAADQFALGVDDQQGADRQLGEGLRRGFRFRARARARRLPARRHPAVHRRRAHRPGGGARRSSPIRRRRWSWASTSPARAPTTA